MNDSDETLPDPNARGNPEREPRSEETPRPSSGTKPDLQDQTQAAGEYTQQFAISKSSTPAGMFAYVGPYKIIEKIGEGGMGAVYLAEQEKPIRRQVAIKVIKNDRGSEQIIVRFEAERQALAMMDHPNIAKVLDAGTAEDGSPYFAMELVSGLPFTEYCDRHQLSIRKRIELFMPVCEAVQHAHQKGIIHRDLKPSNVLVGMYDGNAVPKVIDFGLAKALEHRSKLTDESVFTEFGAIVGTLQYMSPEQAGMNDLDIDTRTDIYSLGVMLYEMLTGSPPLDKEALKKNVLLNVLQLIRESEPPRPSIRLSQFGETLGSVSDRRMIEPRRLKQILRGELDWIVMKSLDKDRARRYETANAFARDLRRYLDNEPIEARPPSWSYRVRKMVRRNQGLAASLVAILLVLIGSLAAITYFWMDARQLAKDNEQIAGEMIEVANEMTLVASARDRETQKALAEAENQRATTDFLFEILGAGDPVFSGLRTRYGQAIGRKATVQQVVKLATEVELDDAKSGFSEQALQRAKILQGLADVCIAGGELQLARQSLLKAEQLLVSERDADPDLQSAIDSDLGKTYASLGLLDYMFGYMGLARENLSTAQNMLQTVLAKKPNDRAVLRKLQDSRLVMGVVLVEYDLHHDAIKQFEAMASIDPNATPEAEVQIRAGEIFAMLTDFDRRQINNESLLPMLPRVAMASMRLLSLPKQIFLGDVFNESITQSIFHGLDAVRKSIPVSTEGGYASMKKMHTSLKETLEAEHVLNCFPLFYQAIYADQLGKKSEALEHIDALLQLVDTNFGVRQHPRLSQVLNLRGELLLAMWREDPAAYPNALSEAERALTQSLAISVPFFTAGHVRIAKAHQMRGSVRQALGLLPEAIEDYRACIEDRKAKYGAKHVRTQSHRRDLINVLGQLARYPEAADEILEAISVYEASSLPYSSELGRLRLELVQTRMKQIGGADLTLEQSVEFQQLLQVAIEELTVLQDAHPDVLKQAQELLDQLQESR